MRLTLPTNWDNHLLDLIADLPVHTLYGKAQRDVIGGGRPAGALPDVDSASIKEHIRRVHQMGIAFNYVLNATCLGNREYLASIHKEIMKKLAELAELEVEYITISVPYLMELVAKNFPNFKIVASVMSGIDSINQARVFEEIGVYEISIEQSLNRNLRFLEKMRKNVKCDMQIVVNNACLFSCPYRRYHQNINAHASQPCSGPLAQVADSYPTLNCARRRLMRPEEVIRSPWVRPEDLSYYEKIGIDKFKLSGRTKTTEWIANAARAYATYNSGENLADILSLPHAGGFLARPPEASQLPRVSYRIHNDRIPADFMDYFARVNCKDLDCDECGYCDRIAERAVEIDEGERTKAVQRYDDLLEELVIDDS